MPNPTRYIHTILAIAALLGVVCATAMGLFVGVASGISSAVGTAIGMANLWALARLVVILVDDEARGARRMRAALFLGAKFLGLVTVVGVLVVKGWVRGGSLMAGLSTVALAIVLGGLLGGGAEPLTSTKEHSTDA